MANDFDQIKTKAFEVFHEPILKGTIGWEQFLDIKGQNTKHLQLGSVLSGGIYAAAGTGDLAADDVDTVNTTIVSTSFEKKERVRWQDLDDNPELVTEIAMGMGGAGLSSLLKLVTDGVAGLFTLAHPNTGLVGAGKKFIDVDLRIGNDAGNLQSNEVNLALSEDAFHAAMTIGAQYKNHKDLVLNLFANGVALIVGPQNRKLAFELLKSALSGADNQANLIQTMGVIGVVLPELDEDWFLVDTTVKPLVLHLRRLPEIEVSRTTDGTWIEIVGRFTATFGVKPTEAGIVGSDAP